jgi:hypothetical protein
MQFPLVDSLKKYMLTEERIDHYLSYSIHNKINKKEINCKNDLKYVKEVKKIENPFFIPRQKDTLFWCFYILVNGIDKYENLNVINIVVEKTLKIEYVEKLRLKKDLLKYDFADYNNIFMKKKEILKTRFHQKLINKKTSYLIGNGEKQFLWACKCRSGKTFMAGSQIIELLEERTNVNVLIITPAPTETLPQFTDELFNSYIDFNDFNIHCITSGKMLKSLEIESNTNNIFIASKQLLQNYTGEKKIKHF